MRRRVRKERKKPELMLSPMIDMIFLLLVFFIVSTINMSEIKSIPIKLPVAENPETVSRSNFTVTVKKDGSIYLEQDPTTLRDLVRLAKQEAKKDENFSILIRGEADASYKLVVKLMDDLKGAGVTRFGLMTDLGEAQ